MTNQSDEAFVLAAQKQESSAVFNPAELSRRFIDEFKRRVDVRTAAIKPRCAVVRHFIDAHVDTIARASRRTLTAIDADIEDAQTTIDRDLLEYDELTAAPPDVTPGLRREIERRIRNSETTVTNTMSRMQSGARQLAESLADMRAQIPALERDWEAIWKAVAVPGQIYVRLGWGEMLIGSMHAMFLVVALVVALGVDHLSPTADRLVRVVDPVDYHAVVILGVFFVEALALGPLVDRAQMAAHWRLYRKLVDMAGKSLTLLSEAEALLAQAEGTMARLSKSST